MLQKKHYYHEKNKTKNKTHKTTFKFGSQVKQKRHFVVSSVLKKEITIFDRSSNSQSYNLEIIIMSAQARKTALPSIRPSGEHFYTKLQVHFGGDVQDIVLKTEKEPTCSDLANALEHTYRISTDKQLIYYRGQRLHHRHASSYDRALSRYGIFSGNLVKLVGRRGLL